MSAVSGMRNGRLLAVLRESDPVSRPGPSGERVMLRQSMLTVFAVTLMYATAQRATMLMFPFGGGEFHAIFAYTDGYLPAALLVFRLHVGMVCAVLALLAVLRYPLQWGLLALAAATVCCIYWWDVVTYPHQRDGFRTTMVALLAAIPPICFATGAIAHRVGGALRGCFTRLLPPDELVDAPSRAARP